jgi:hypothetical protein
MASTNFSTHGNTNNRSICYSIFRNTWLYLALVQHLDCDRHIPKPFEFTKSTDPLRLSNDQQLALNNDAGLEITIPSNTLFLDNITKAVVNHLAIKVGTFVRSRAGSYGRVQRIMGCGDMVIIAKMWMVIRDMIGQS